MATLTRDEGGGVKAFIAEAWTLEFDLALQPALAADVHLAVQLAKTTSRNPAWLEKIRLEAAQAYADWKRQGLSDVEIAVNIFRPVHDKAASKAEVAEQLAAILRARAETPEAMRAILPPYLVAALDHVTGGAPGPAGG